MLRIRVLSVGPIATNCYIVHAPDNRAFLVDPGCQWEPILEAIQGLKLTDILITHAHWDHIGGVGPIQRETGARVWAPELEANWLADPELNGSAGMGFWTDPVTAPPADELLKGGERLSLLGEEIDVLHTPGHSPGHLSYRMGDVVFGGDVLFAGSVGRTDLPGGDPETLIQSIREKLYTLDPQTTVLPGHGPATTIAHEMENNPFVRL